MTDISANGKSHASESLSPPVNRAYEGLGVLSPEVQDIVGSVPSSILTYGLVCIFLIVAGLITGAYFIHYPDMLQATVVITTQNPPAGVLAKTSGKLWQVNVHDNDTVQANEILAVIENTATLDSIIRLKSVLARFTGITASDIGQLQKTLPKTSQGLGEVAIVEQQFADAVKEYEYAYWDSSRHEKVKNALSQINYQNDLQQKLIEQSSLEGRKADLEKEKLEAYESLGKQKVISPLDLKDAQQKMIDNNINFANTNIAVISNKLSMEQMRLAILNLSQEDKEKKQAASIGLDQAYQKLNTDIDNWIQKYVLKSPCPGRVVFTKFWSQSQDVASGDIVFTVVSGNQGILAKGYVPIYKSSKMHVGQKVNIKLANYPFEQYGILTGRVLAISEIPLQDNYLVTIDFPKGLITTYNKNLRFYPEMKGTGQIVLADERLLTKLFRQFRKAGDIQ